MRRPYLWSVSRSKTLPAWSSIERQPAKEDSYLNNAFEALNVHESRKDTTLACRAGHHQSSIHEVNQVNGQLHRLSKRRLLLLPLCRFHREDSRHHAKAVISQKTLKVALANSRIVLLQQSRFSPVKSDNKQWTFLHRIVRQPDSEELLKEKLKVK
jgi:hypothetical protein